MEGAGDTEGNKLGEREAVGVDEGMSDGTSEGESEGIEVGPTAMFDPSSVISDLFLDDFPLEDPAEQTERR